MASRCRSARWGEYLRRWGFSPRHPQRWAYEQQPQAIKKWRHEHYPAIKARAHAEGAEIQWGDETGIGRAMKPVSAAKIIAAEGMGRREKLLLPERVHGGLARV